MNRSTINLHLGDSLEAMRVMEDNAFDLTACELDKDYFDAAMKRLAQHQSQTTLF